MDTDWSELRFEFIGFEWSREKAASNKRKHNVEFKEAALIFGQDVVARVDYVEGEERYIALGASHARLLAVVFTEREGRCRIISARPAEKRERRRYRSLYGR